MNALEIHREAIEWANWLLEAVMADVTPEQAHWTPPGIANPLGALYAHAVLDQDVIVNAMLKGGAPLYASSWADRCGVEDPRFQLDLEWARAVQIDLDALRAYAKAVYASVLAYLDGLSEADLEREVDLSANGLGVRSVGWMLTALIAAHTNNMAGEISCLKGLQGAQGYPF